MFFDKEAEILRQVAIVKQRGESLKPFAEIVGMTERQFENWIILKTGDRDFEYFCSSQLYIEDGSEVKSFRLNNAQKKLLAEVERQKKLNRPIRIVNLKCRQFGGTTFWSALNYREMKRKKNRHATTISYSLTSAEHIRGMANRYHSLDKYAKPRVKGKSEKVWQFTDNDSSWMIETAENLHAGHSFTNQILHASEISRWQGDAETIMRGLTSTIQATPDTMIIIESTANGFGDYFYSLWQEAKEGNSTYIPVFTSWLEIEKYKMDFVNDKTFEDETKASFERRLDEDERRLIETHGASLEQLHWRRFKIKELKGDVDGFKEQYPSTDIEAFLSSGRPYFPITIVRNEYAKAKKEVVKRGNLKWNDDEVEFEEDSSGLWRIADFPNYDFENRYVSGADPAEGKAVDEGNKNPDYSECYVYDRYRQKMVAMFKARVDTDVFEDELHKAYVWYNQCLLCPERNNTAGGAIIRGLKDKVFLYRKVSITKENETESEELGYHTAGGVGGTREELLNELRLRIKKNSKPAEKGHEPFIIPFEEFWDEASKFIIDKTGKPIHQTGGHDDGIFASGLSLQADIQASDLFPIEKNEEHVGRSFDSSPLRDEEPDNLIYAQF